MRARSSPYGCRSAASAPSSSAPACACPHCDFAARYPPGMRRRKGTPVPFQRVDVVERPVDAAAIDAAIATFIEHFVAPARRDRARFELGSPPRRWRGLDALERWLDPRRSASLEGNTGFPQHLHARFGARPGVLVRERDGARMTIAEAASIAGDRAFFLADDGQLALVFVEIGPPYLCTR